MDYLKYWRQALVGVLVLALVYGFVSGTVTADQLGALLERLLAEPPMAGEQGGSGMPDPYAGLLLASG
jgi:predicted DNA repair protein MutK